MTTKRVFVPAALHNELTEYTNLIRVLRTNRALDLTTHLLNHVEEQKVKTEADTWTSWPLIDCPVPEWSLSDEIHHLGESVMQKRAQDANECSDAESSNSDFDALSPTAASCLVLHTGALLVRILNLMADQRPSAPGSMQNRLWPMNWQDVISVLAVNRLVNPTVVARAEKRLERIYGPSNTKAVERVESVTSAQRRFATLASIHEDQLLAPPILHPRVRRNDGRSRQSYKVRPKSRAVIDTDSDA
ncbi:hypothetical protein JVU11DRAFT_10140 [Chiua virens]|nr:hypothetical protein JVU11DRAFT_10140 [Chiua virens]